MSVTLNLDEKNFILGNFPKTTSFIIQFFIFFAKYYINRNSYSKKHLNFFEYRGSCSQWDHWEKDGSKKWDQSLITEEKPLF